MEYPNFCYKKALSLISILTPVFLIFFPAIADAGGNKCFKDSKAKLAKLVAAGSRTSDQMIQQFKGVAAGKAKKDFAGGESHIFLDKENPRLALKVYNSHIGNVDESIDNLIRISEAVNSGKIKSITRGKIVAPDILDRGTNWVTRSFFPNSVSLNEVEKITDRNSKKICLALMESVKSTLQGHGSNQLGKDIAQRIKVKSVNIHCDFESGRLVIIDSIYN